MSADIGATHSKVLDIIDGKRKAPFLSYALRVCSLLYGSAVAFRHLAYRLGVCKTHKIAAFVVSVGNIACGGTGKTPFVRFITKSLSPGCKIAILSRGYRSPSEHLPHPVLITGEHGPLLSAAVCGDEPYLLASTLPGVAVWVGKHRHEAARRSAQKGTDVVILDDGMQYRKLARDIEIVIVDGQDILAGGRLLPAGRLRDFPHRLRSADLIVVNHAQEDISLSAYQQQLSPFTQAPLITVCMRPVVQDEFMKRAVQGGELIEGRPVGVFCALGRPDRFVAAVRNFPAQVVAVLTAPDHSSHAEASLQNFALLCRKKGAEALVCSAKDAVKLPPRLALDLPLVILDAEMEILQGQDTWNAMLDRIKTQIELRKRSYA